MATSFLRVLPEQDAATKCEAWGQAFKQLWAPIVGGPTPKRRDLRLIAWSRPERFRGCVAAFFHSEWQRNCLTDYLSRNVVLAQHFKSFACEHGAGAVRIVDVQSDRRKTARPNQQRISEMNIDLRHDQCREQFNQLRGHFPHFNHHHLADPETNIVFPKQFFDALRVASDDPRNRWIGGFRHAKGDNVRVMRAKQLHNFQHRPHFVRQKNRELLH